MEQNNQQNKPQESFVAKPASGVFERKEVTRGNMLHAGQRFPILDRVEEPEGGGILTYIKTFPYPIKGFPFPEALQANDIMKRIAQTFVRIAGNRNMILSILGFLVLPWKRKMSVVTTLVSSMSRISEWVLGSYYLKEIRYSPVCRELMKMIQAATADLGIPEVVNTIPQEIHKVIATMIEYDDSYRYRLQDIMGETTAAKLLESPRAEVMRLLDIYLVRESDPRVQANFVTFKRAASVLLLHPKIRRAFRAAVRAGDLSKMILDNADRYHILLKGGYNYTGRTIEERYELLKEFHQSRNIPYPQYAEVAPDAEQGQDMMAR